MRIIYSFLISIIALAMPLTLLIKHINRNIIIENDKQRKILPIIHLLVVVSLLMFGGISVYMDTKHSLIEQAYILIIVSMITILGEQHRFKKTKIH